MPCAWGDAQDQALSHAAELFAEGDVDKDGFLACEEMVNLMKKVIPHIAPCHLGMLVACCPMARRLQMCTMGRRGGAIFMQALPLMCKGDHHGKQPRKVSKPG